MKVYIRAVKRGISKEDLPDELKKIKEILKDVPGVIIHVDDDEEEK